jgi:polyvinyl alcohol dehydrogenase (cytochrome)
MRAQTGCLQWVYQANGPVRSSIVAVPFGRQHALLFGDMTGWFYALQAETGKLLWKVHIETHDSTRLTGAPVAYKETVYVPVASWEETRASDPEYPCCTFRGSVVALRIRDGARLWKTYMTKAPTETGKNARGIAQFGPSGVGIWSAPTVDAKRGVLYVATGDNYSSPATDTSDAVMALNLATGRIVWSKQITTGDAYNGSCRGDRVNCPAQSGPTSTLLPSAILISAPDGHDVFRRPEVRIVYAPTQPEGGDRVATRVGQGGTNGGVQWVWRPTASVYASVSDVGSTR